MPQVQNGDGTRQILQQLRFSLPSKACSLAAKADVRWTCAAYICEQIQAIPGGCFRFSGLSRDDGGKATPPIGAAATIMACELPYRVLDLRAVRRRGPTIRKFCTSFHPATTAFLDLSSLTPFTRGLAPLPAASLTCSYGLRFCPICWRFEPASVDT